MESKLELYKSGLISGIELNGVELYSLTEKIDSRGSFTEIFQKHWDSCINPVQWSVVKSGPKVFRGMHYHNRHDEYFCLISGKCLVGLKDLRKESNTYDCYSLYDLNYQDAAALTFPKGILHGWYFYEESIHIQAVSESYKNYYTDDNIGCRWDDKNLGIPWPFDKVILSEKADNFDDFIRLKSILSF